MVDPSDPSYWTPLNMVQVEVGRIASQHAAIELIIDMMIWDLAGIEQDLGACITSQIPSIFTKLRSLTALINQFENADNLVKRLSKFGETMRPVAEKRNRAIHEAWGIGDDGTTTLIIKNIIGRDIVFRGVDKNRSELSVITTELGRLMKLIHEIQVDFSNWSESNKRKRKKQAEPMIVGHLVTIDEDKE